ncbi:hypothetical protein [Paenibacillus sanguinis]|uniref:hypothetical protein n=1 Tax=Paenibacillus sanguinis TaxID=225906 RepID=UPI00037AD383|nr:hypothetical protein [Paenibacillus sanguinis]
MSAKFKFKRELFEEELLGYSPEQVQLIADYFAVTALTRKAGLISPGVIRRQLVYWQRFSVDIVMQALRLHIKQYPDKPEQYTQGIMRTLEKGAEARRAKAGASVAEFVPSRRNYGQGDDRYIGDDDPLPI